MHSIIDSCFFTMGNNVSVFNTSKRAFYIYSSLCRVSFAFTSNIGTTKSVYVVMYRDILGRTDHFVTFILP